MNCSPLKLLKIFSWKQKTQLLRNDSKSEITLSLGMKQVFPRNIQFLFHMCVPGISCWLFQGLPVTGMLVNRTLKSSLENNCWQLETMKTRIYQLCLLQHIVGPIPILRNSFPNIGQTWADQVPQENLGKRDFMITYRKPPSLKDMLVRAKTAQTRTTTHKGCTRPNTCKYCKKSCQSGKIKNLHNNKTLQYNDYGHLPE